MLFKIISVTYYFWQKYHRGVLKTHLNIKDGNFCKKSSRLDVVNLDVRLGSEYTSTPKQPTRKVLRKMCSENMQQFTGENQCRSVISIKLQSSFIEIRFRYGCSPVDLLHIFRTPFYKSTSGGLLLSVKTKMVCFDNQKP